MCESRMGPLLIVKGGGPTLFGRDWMSVIRLDWGKIHYTPSTGLQERYEEVFRDGLGTFRGRKAYSKATILHGKDAMRPKVDKNLTD